METRWPSRRLRKSFTSPWLSVYLYNSVYHVQCWPCCMQWACREYNWALCLLIKVQPSTIDSDFALIHSREIEDQIHLLF